MPSTVEATVKCPVCGKFLAALAPQDNGVTVSCHGLTIRVERQGPIETALRTVSRVDLETARGVGKLLEVDASGLR